MIRISRALVSVALASLCAVAVEPAAKAQSAGTDRYVLCTFRPQTPSCEAVYQRALHDDQSPGADAVKAAFDGYGRYVHNAVGALTDEDLRYLTANGIRLPELTPEDQAGLHAVLSDPVLQKDPETRRIAVNNFLGRAVQAELYCAFNSCENAERMAFIENGTSEIR